MNPRGVKRFFERLSRQIKEKLIPYTGFHPYTILEKASKVSIQNPDTVRQTLFVVDLKELRR